MPSAKSTAIQTRIFTHPQESKTGTCKACRANAQAARMGSPYRIPPLHPNCKCGDNLARQLA